MGIPFERKNRFRINPIEVAVFAVVSLIFVKSAYSLLYSGQEFEPAALTAENQNPFNSASNPSAAQEDGSGRSPASAGPSASAPAKIFSDVKLGCDPDKQTVVSSNKVRFIGDLCSGETSQNVKKINVVNTSAKIIATVFPDFGNARFSTDYISLSQGVNQIDVEYEFKNGKTVSRLFNVTKD